MGRRGRPKKKADTWTDIYGTVYTVEKPKRPVQRPRERPPVDPNLKDRGGRPAMPPRPKPTNIDPIPDTRYPTPKFLLQEMRNGIRDERGVRILTFKGNHEYDDSTGEALSAIYTLARTNMQRRLDGKALPKYSSVEQLQQKIIEYWEYLENANQNGIALIPDMEGVCSFLGISRTTFRTWERENFQGFAETLAQVRNDIAACKKQLGLQNKIPAIVMAMDFNNNHDYVQKQEVQVATPNLLGESTKIPELAEKYMDLIEGEFEEIHDDEPSD